MSAPRSDVTEWIEQGQVPPEQVAAALHAANVYPARERWLRLADQLLLWFGGIALACALLFFIAYNLHDFSRAAKFALVQGFIILAISVYLKWPNQAAIGKTALFVAALGVGVLFALYFQSYQTGADPWQLFFYWAIAILPWASVARITAMWLLVLVLLNLSIVLYLPLLDRFFGFWGAEYSTWWWLFVLNTVALVLWELCAIRYFWLQQRWAIRLIAVASGMTVNLLVFVHLVSNYNRLPGYEWFYLAWILWLVALFVVYQVKIFDLFMLAGGCLSFIFITLVFMATHMLDDPNAGSFLFLGAYVVGMATLSALWLNRLHREQP